MAKATKNTDASQETPKLVTDLVAHLRRTHTGESKIQQVQDIAKTVEDSTEFLRECKLYLPDGTYQKVEAFVVGADPSANPDAYADIDPNAPLAERELAAERIRLEALRREVESTSATFAEDREKLNRDMKPLEDAKGAFETRVDAFDKEVEAEVNKRLNAKDADSGGDGKTPAGKGQATKTQSSKPHDDKDK